jgi:hypothetical protein
VLKPHGTYRERGELKLREVLGQVTGVRRRINSIAIQHGIFSALGYLLAAAAIAFAAAFTLPPLYFLLICTVAAGAAAIGIVFAVRSALRTWIDPEGAAALADERAALNGRLSALLAVAHQPPEKRSQLWSYLVEDALLSRAEFTPARIQRRRVPRSIFGLAAAAVLALLVMPLRTMAPVRLAGAAGQQNPLTLDLRDLTIDPSTGSGGNGAGSQISGDPAAMRKLADMIARARQRQKTDPLGQMLKSANRLASKLQNRITGERNRPPVKIRLASNGDDSQKGPGRDGAQARPDGSGGNHDETAGAKPDDSDQNYGIAIPSQPPAGEQSGEPGPLAREGPAAAPQPRQRQAAPGDSKRATAQQSGEHENGGGASHGAGSDPNSLFGKADSQAHPANGFQIAIEAHPASAGDDNGEAMRGPRVSAELNAEQYPDEPVGRTAVPDNERDTIRRIFDR